MCTPARTGLKTPCYIEAKTTGSGLSGVPVQTSEVCETSEVLMGPGRPGFAQRCRAELVFAPGLGASYGAPLPGGFALT